MPRLRRRPEPPRPTSPTSPTSPRRGAFWYARRSGSTRGDRVGEVRIPTPAALDAPALGVRPRAAALAATLACALACGGGHTGDGDASTDGAAGDAAAAPWYVSGGLPPVAAPALSPCPAGWREVAHASGVAACDPYPEGGPRSCPPGEAHLPGAPGCAPLGRACPTGDFPDALPADAPVVRVLAGAPAGGDGSEARPYARLGDFALGGLPSGAVIALGKGEYDESVRLPRGLTLAGACARETALVPSVAAGFEAALAFYGDAVTVRDLRVGPTPRLGISIEGRRGARLQGVSVEGAGMVGVLALGSELHAQDLGVRDTAPRASDGQLGMGMVAEGASDVRVERARVAGSAMAGLSIGEGGTFEACDLAVHGTSGTRDGAWGYGLAFQDAVQARVERLVVDGARSAGLHLGDAGTALQGRDLVVRAVEVHGAAPPYGYGIAVATSSAATLARVHATANRVAGIAVGDAGELDLSDALVSDQLGLPGAFGRGLSVESGGALRATRVVLALDREAAALATEVGSSLELSDARVWETAGALESGVRGRAVQVQLGAHAGITRAVLARSREAGALVAYEGSELVLEDVAVAEVLPRDCAPSTCGDAPGGHGLVAMLGGRARATRFAVRAASLCGVLVGEGGALDLEDGEIAGSSFGACIQSPGYDLSRLTRSVRYRDNEVALETTSLPVPEAELPGTFGGT